jgi:hypothetical protein
MANGREIWSGDSVPAKYLTGAIVRGDGFLLDRYRHDVLKWWPNPGLPYYATMVDGHLVSRYPFGSAIVALPFAVPQILVLDRFQPDWDASDPDWFDTIAKCSAAAMATLVALAVLAVLLRLGLGRDAWLAATAAALGSNLWCTASQSLWQHGPAALMLTLLLLLLWPESPSPMRFVAAGLAAGLLVCCRPINLPFAAMTAFWVAIRHPRRLVWFIGPVLPLAAALIGYNREYVGAAGGYYANLDAATFATPWSEGLLGTLLSPSRGLFIFSPWTVVAVVYLPFALFRLRPATLLPWLLATLIPHALIISTFACWWAGLCFGPRYWTEVIPLLAIPLGLALHWARDHGRPIFAVTLVLIAISIVVQILGAALYPSSWQEVPPETGGDGKRLWNWTDNELSRCIMESKAYNRLFGPAEPVRPTPIATPEIPASNQPAPPPPPISPRAAGSLDRVDCDQVAGWAWDPQQPDTPIKVDLYDGAALLTTATANRLRRDLVLNQKGNGRHGFVFDTPASLKDGTPHQIHAKVTGPGTELNKSPKELNCPEPEPR